MQPCYDGFEDRGVRLNQTIVAVIRLVLEGEDNSDWCSATR